LHDLDSDSAYAVISATDTGTGMDKETSEKIFNPFFTTKEVGKGTGLGLSIAYGIIKQHNGSITVHSELSEGTTFKVYLPLITAPVEAAPAVAPAPLRGGTETILIAEDNESVRNIIRISLERAGYKVIEATDGEEAIRTFTAHKDSIQLVLLDVVMPKKNGKEVFDQIKSIDPSVKVLFLSGYTADIVHRKGIRDGSIDFIPKPVSPDTILLKVREVLDKMT
jgi:CheY-like chemotaxis protein